MNLSWSSIPQNEGEERDEEMLFRLSSCGARRGAWRG